ncbi:MAG TPA: indole-3-glycerol phosphate synthase TrpC [Blastocatellia bacterium]|nr:indole-3-glycerol phosphate synthase TrpC [Blastocatellia bacterium]
MLDRWNKPEGVVAAGGILDRIVAAKAIRLKMAKLLNPIDSTAKVRTQARGSGFSFVERISTEGATNIIAELKRRSPSKGVIREEYDPRLIAATYERGGAAALSVLTEEDFFGGSLDHLRSLNQVKLPLLRKDFIFDEYQVYEAAFAGADAVLLIVAILDDEMLSRLIRLADELRVAALVEVHTATEMKRAVAAGAVVIGVNNRDLTTFKVDLETSLRLASLAPAGTILVSESGINSAGEIARLKSAGFSAFLIGEHFMRAADPGEALHRLVAESE